MIRNIITKLELRKHLTQHIIVRECPFCASVGMLYQVADTWRCECVNYADCGASGPIAATPEDAAAKWNEVRR